MLIGVGARIPQDLTACEAFKDCIEIGRVVDPGGCDGGVLYLLPMWLQNQSSTAER